MVDTNSDPTNIDYVIPANDDASKSIEVVLDAVTSAMAEGLEERKVEKVDTAAAGEADEAAPKRERRRVRRAEAAESSEAEAAATEEVAE